MPAHNILNLFDVIMIHHSLIHKNVDQYVVRTSTLDHIMSFQLKYHSQKFS